MSFHPAAPRRAAHVAMRRVPVKDVPEAEARPGPRQAIAQCPDQGPLRRSKKGGGGRPGRPPPERVQRSRSSVTRIAVSLDPDRGPGGGHGPVPPVRPVELFESPVPVGGGGGRHPPGGGGGPRPPVALWVAFPVSLPVPLPEGGGGGGGHGHGGGALALPVVVLLSFGGGGHGPRRVPFWAVSSREPVVPAEWEKSVAAAPPPTTRLTASAPRITNDAKPRGLVRMVYLDPLTGAARKARFARWYRNLPRLVPGTVRDRRGAIRSPAGGGSEPREGFEPSACSLPRSRSAS
jgi:hypothetical protein